MSGGPALWEPLAALAFLEPLRALIAQCVAPDAAEIDKKDIYPLKPVRALAAAGYNSMTLPVEFGGGGRPFRECVALFEEVGYASGAVATGLITIFQASTIIAMFGNESLKRLFLPQMKEGLICSYAMTEAAHGSDVKHLDTKAVRDGDSWVIDGEKSFVTSASAAGLFVILAETEKGVSAFAVTRETPGARTYVGRVSHTFGLRNGPHVNLELKKARIPLDHLIGEEGKGIRLALTTLDHSRVLAAAIQVGIARAAFDGALAFARERVAFGQHVVEFQGIQWYLADLLSEIDAVRLLTWEAGRALEEHREIARWSAEAKLLAGKVAVATALQAIQICGAYGTVENAPFGRYLRDAKTYEIAGGSSEILKNTIGKHLQRTILP